MIPRPWLPKLSLVVLLTGTLAACDDAETTAQQAATPPPAVTVATPLVEELIEWDEFTGRFEAVEDVTIRARVTGYVQEIHFTDGQLVEAGDLLITIDPRTYQADVAVARAELVAAEAARRLARDELARVENLTVGRTITQQAIDNARRAREAADANVEAARANLARAELDVEFTEVRAPTSGRISDSKVDVGDLVIGDANPTELTRVVTLDPVYFSFDVSERDFLGYQRSRNTGEMATARSGDVFVELKLTDETDWVHTGTIDFVDNALNEGTGTIRMRALVQNAEGSITPGLFGRLRLPGSPLYDALLIPDSAILSDQAQKIVFVVNADNIVEPRPIRPGPRELGLRIIREGLTAEDRIITRGLLRARPGVPVTPEMGEITPPAPFAAAN